MDFESYATYLVVVLVAALAAGAALNYAEQADTVDQLQVDLDDAQEHVDELEASITGYQQQVADYENEVTLQETTIEDLNDEVATLEDDLASAQEYTTVVEADYEDTFTVYRNVDGVDYESEFEVTYNVGDEDDLYDAGFEYDYDTKDDVVQGITVEFYDQTTYSVGEADPVATFDETDMTDREFSAALEQGTYDVVVTHDLNESAIEDDEDNTVDTAYVTFEFSTTEDFYVQAE